MWNIVYRIIEWAKNEFYNYTIYVKTKISLQIHLVLSISFKK